MTDALADRLRRGCENAILALVYLHFFYAHAQQAQLSGQWWAMAPILTQESLLALLFLTRRPSTSTSTRPQDWIVAALGTFLPLTIRAGGAPFALGPYVQLVGFAVSLTGLLSLNRSIGIVAANRGVKTGGAYRVVRHPMYAGHFVCLLGYVCTYPSLRNAAIVAATACALLARIAAEERVLRASKVYRWYARRVRYRLVPRLY
jgi:protein-S-isoprenylcysteine O-methyltransferase Ste14